KRLRRDHVAKAGGAGWRRVAGEERATAQPLHERDLVALALRVEHVDDRTGTAKPRGRRIEVGVGDPPVGVRGPEEDGDAGERLTDWRGPLGGLAEPRTARGEHAGERTGEAGRDLERETRALREACEHERDRVGARDRADRGERRL